MKRVLTAAAILGVFAAPALATPSDAFTLCVLLGAAALGSTLVDEMIVSKRPWVGSRAHSRIDYGYIRR
jgi:hypothetical protein